MAYYTPLLEKAQKQGSVPLLILSPIHLQNVEGMGLGMGSGTSLVSEHF